MAIRFTKKYNEEIVKTVRNYNAKINRLRKSNKNYVLPPKAYVKTLKLANESRTELNRALKNLRLFTQRGMEEVITTDAGFTTSKYEMTVLKKEVRQAKAILTRKIHEYENITPTVFGRKQSATYKQMGSAMLRNLETKRESLNKDFKKIDKRQFIRMKATAINAINWKPQFKAYRGNFIKVLMQLAPLINYDKTKLKYITTVLENMTLREFNLFCDTEKVVKAIFEFYANLKKKTTAQIYTDLNSLYDGLHSAIFSFQRDYQISTEPKKT